MASVGKNSAPDKRHKIDRSGRVMFAWVAGVSVLVGFALVLGGFLFQRIVFESRVLQEKMNTVSTLDSNIAAYDTLRDNVRILNASSALRSVTISDSERPLQVILDALPADGNTLALGASIQNLVKRTQGVQIESFSIEHDSEAAEVSADASDSSTVQDVQRMRFNLEVSARDVNSLRDVLKTFEHSIRVIDIESSSLEVNEEGVKMMISAHAYYMPSKTVSLGKKEIKP